LELLVRVFTVVRDDVDDVVDADDANDVVGVVVAVAAGAAVAVAGVVMSDAPDATFVAAAGVVVFVSAAVVAAWLCSACLPIKALSATKAATPTAVTRRFQVRLRSIMRGFVIAITPFRM
jgi:hypothetical protein